MKDYLSNLGPLEIGLLIAAVIIVACVLVLQWYFYSSTKKKILQLKKFFPSAGLTIVQTSITKEDLKTNETLDKFIANPPARHKDVVPAVVIGDEEDDYGDNVGEEEPDPIEYTDIDLVKVSRSSIPFKEIVYETNAYLCKNVGTSADFSILQDICERKLEALETQISNSINVPLYLGLAGTFIGIITGLAGIAGNVNDLFANGNMNPLINLLIGVVLLVLL